MPLPHKSNRRTKHFDLSGKRALIITTSKATLDKVDATTGEVLKKGKATGVYASELTEAYYTFLDANMTVDVASIRGGKIPIDPFSLWPAVRTEHDVRYLNDPELKEKAQRSIAIKDVDISAYDIVFMAGGWGAAYDLAQSEVLSKKISEAYAAKTVIAAVCHGSLGFIGANKPDGSPLVEGVKMTGVTNKQLKELMVSGTPKHPETELRNANAIYSCKTGLLDVLQTHVVVDEHHRIVTGQNQKAGVETAQKALELLLQQEIENSTSKSMRQRPFTSSRLNRAQRS